MRFQARSVRHNDEGVNTAIIECTATVGGEGGSLPDLGGQLTELHDSLRISTENFGPGSCALVEGCVDGTGRPQTPALQHRDAELWPGDVFLGKPGG
jgi:hypothetical protein